MSSPKRTPAPLRLKILGPSAQEWYVDTVAVPAVGDQCTIWTSTNKFAWGGVVESVNWGFAENFDGMFVVIQLAAMETPASDQVEFSPRS